MIVLLKFGFNSSYVTNLNTPKESNKTLRWTNRGQLDYNSFLKLKDKYILNVYVVEPIQTISIYDVLGELVFTQNYSTEKLQTINISALSGIYVLVLELKGGKKLKFKYYSE
jgi:hypothetical protein